MSHSHSPESMPFFCALHYGQHEGHWRKQAADVYSNVFELLPRSNEFGGYATLHSRDFMSQTNMGRVLLKDYVGTICHTFPDNFMHLG